MDKSKPRMEICRLTAAERREIEQRALKHRDRLTQQGYTIHALTDETGCFGVVLVSDPKSGRKGLLMPDGKVRWIDHAMSPGALADAAVSGVRIDGLPE